MIMKMYSIKDRFADNGGFAPPYPNGNDDLAKRTFKTLILTEAVRKFNKSDFELWFVGTFDTESGTMLCDPKKMKIIMKGDEIHEN